MNGDGHLLDMDNKEGDYLASNSMGAEIDAQDGNLVIRVGPQTRTSNYDYRAKCVVRARIPTEKKGQFHLLMYECDYDKGEHLAIVYGSDILSRSLDMSRLYPEAEYRLRGVMPRLEVVRKRLNNTTFGKLEQEPILLRIHSSCFTSENVGSTRCDCRDQLDEAMDLMSKEGNGVVLYLRQEGRGIGLKGKLLAYNLIDMGYDTVSANLMLHKKPDMRSYQVAIDILNDLNIKAVRLLTNNPQKVSALTDAGIQVERVPMTPKSWKRLISSKNEDFAPGLGNHNELNINAHIDELDLYLVSKVKRMGHIIDIPKEILDKIGEKKYVNVTENINNYAHITDTDNLQK